MDDLLTSYIQVLLSDKNRQKNTNNNNGIYQNLI